MHANEADLYGHVVATNMFGDAYVLPSIETFENIRQCLDASSVDLPSLVDLPLKRRKRKVSRLSKSRWTFKFRRETIRSPGHAIKAPRDVEPALLSRCWPKSFGAHKRYQQPIWHADKEQISDADLIKSWIAIVEVDSQIADRQYVRDFFEEAQGEHPWSGRDAQSPNVDNGGLDNAQDRHSSSMRQSNQRGRFESKLMCVGQAMS